MNPYTDLTWWVRRFKEDPTSIKQLLREWECLAFWLIQGERPLLLPGDHPRFANIEEAPQDYIDDTLSLFAEMSELIIAWTDHTLHANVECFQRLIDKIQRLRWDTDPVTGSECVRPSQEELQDDFGDALSLLRRLELAAAIASGTPAPPRLNEVEERIRDAIEANPGISLKDLAGKVGRKEGAVKQYLKKKSKLYKMGYRQRREKGSGYWPPPPNVKR